MSVDFQYAAPLDVKRIEACKFSHSIDLPGVGEVPGDWDLRETADAVLGNVGFSGKRALDVGAASGFLTFEMEKRGADVVSFDVERIALGDIVPYWNLRHEYEEALQRQERVTKRLRNAYWFAHKKLESRAKVYYGNDFYHLPEALGTFDVVFFGMTLSRLRDPFQALYSASRLCTDTVIVTNQATPAKQPVMSFRPNAERSAPLSAWWSFSEVCLQQMLNVLGFKVQDTIRHPHRRLLAGRNEEVEHTALVARRVPGTSTADG